MFKYLISGGLIALSLVFLKLGTLSFIDASSLFDKFEFSNLFVENNWLKFQQIFNAYFVFTILVIVLIWVNFKALFEYISKEKNQFKLFVSKWISEIKQNKLLYILIILLVTIGIIIRSLQLNRPIRYDESFTFLEYGRSYIGYTLMNYSYPNNHILHSVMVRLSTMNFGNDLWAIRLPAFIGGILVLIFTFFAGRKWLRLKGATIALSLVVFSDWLIGYSVNARGYSLQTALFLIVLFLTWGKQESKGRLLIIAVLNAIGFWIIPSYIFCLATLFLIVFLKNGFQYKLFLSCILSILLSILLYLPVIAYSGTDSLFNNPNTQTYNSLSYFQDFLSNLTTIYRNLIPGQGVIKLLFFITFIATSFIKQTKWLSIGIVSLFCLMMIILGNHTPPRVFMFLIPIAALVFAGSISIHLKSAILYPIVFIPFISWSIYKNQRFDYEIALNDLPEIMRDIKNKGGSKVVSRIPLNYPIRYYLSKEQTLNHSSRNDSIYVITSEFHQQDLKAVLSYEIKEVQFSPIKHYKYLTLYSGVKE